MAANASTGSQAEAGAPGLHREPDDRNKMNAGACKLLFPEPLTKSKTPEEFRLWTSEFRRFADASGLLKQNAATQQGYLLRALDLDLKKVVAQKVTPAMTLYGAGGCMELIEEEFKVIYPVFNRHFDFFQLKRGDGEDVSDYLTRVAATSDMADLEAMNKEELSIFQFLASLRGHAAPRQAPGTEENGFHHGQRSCCLILEEGKGGERDRCQGNKTSCSYQRQNGQRGQNRAKPRPWEAQIQSHDPRRNERALSRLRKP